MPANSASAPMTSSMIGARMSARTKVGRTRKKSVTRISRCRPAADEAGDDPDQGADDDRDERRQEPDEHRDPGAVDGQVEDVAAELVGAQHVLRVGGSSGSPVAVVTVSSGPTNSAGRCARTVKNDEDDEPDDAVRSGRANRRPNARRPATRSASARPGAPLGAVDGRRRRSCPDPRVEEAVDEVGREVGHHDRDDRSRKMPCRTG